MNKMKLYKEKLFEDIIYIYKMAMNIKKQVNCYLNKKFSSAQMINNKNICGGEENE